MWIVIVYAKNHERFHPFFKHIRCVIFWLKKYVIAQIGFQSYGGHWAGQRRELIYYDCFLFSINTYTHLLGVVSLRKLYFWISFLGICGFVCLDLSGVVGDNHLWEEISTIGSRCSHGPTPSSTPDRTPLESSQIFLFLTPKKQTNKHL